MDPFKPKPKLVLIVEDDFYIRDLYRVALEHSDFRVITVPDGEQAMEILETIRPDLVLLDLMLPKANGFDVLKFIRDAEHIPNHLPVVIITNLETEDAYAKAEALAADLYIRKSSSRPAEVVEQVKLIFQTQEFFIIGQETNAKSSTDCRRRFLYSRSL